MPCNDTLQLSVLTLAIVAGMVLGNAAGGRLPSRLQPGSRFSQQKIPSLGVMLDGSLLPILETVRKGRCCRLIW